MVRVRQLNLTLTLALSLSLTLALSLSLTLALALALSLTLTFLDGDLAGAAGERRQRRCTKDPTEAALAHLGDIGEMQPRCTGDLGEI